MRDMSKDTARIDRIWRWIHNNVPDEPSTDDDVADVVIRLLAYAAAAKAKPVRPNEVRSDLPERAIDYGEFGLVQVVAGEFFGPDYIARFNASSNVRDGSEQPLEHTDTVWVSREWLKRAAKVVPDA